MKKHFLLFSGVVLITGSIGFLIYQNHHSNPPNIQNVAKSTMQTGTKETLRNLPFTIVIKNTGKSPIATGAGTAENNALWIEFSDGSKELIVISKEDKTVEKTIAGIHNAQLAPDKQKIYFMSSAWATSDSIHVVNLTTKAEKYLCDGNTLEVIQSGVNRGKLIIQKHKYNDAPDFGSYDHYFLVNENGNELKDLGEDYKDFLQSSAPPIDRDATEELSRIEGVWINDKYMNFLQETGSPIQAQDKIKGLPYFEISHSKAKYYYGGSDFNQGIGNSIQGIEFKPDNSGFNLILGNTKDDTTKIGFSTDDRPGKALRILNFYDEPGLCYSRVECNVNKIENYISGRVINGKYKDQNGKLYIFYVDGTADWPDGKVNYHVNLSSYPVSDHDYFNYAFQDNSKRNGTFCFQKEGRNILFFRAKWKESPELELLDTKPYLLLTKVD